MIAAIADTHATIWYLFSDPRLGKAASVFIDSTIASGNHIGVSAITFAEMVYLIDKGRIRASALNDLHVAIADPKAALQHVAL
jgi:PIN domain nuclease of toxin-antitoxin system